MKPILYRKITAINVETNPTTRMQAPPTPDDYARSPSPFIPPAGDAEAGGARWEGRKDEKYWGHMVGGIFMCWFFGFLGFIPLCCMSYTKPKRSYAIGGLIGIVLALITFVILGLVSRSYVSTLVSRK